MYAINKFSSRIFNFDKKYNTYNQALTDSGIILPPINPIVNPIYYNYTQYIYSL